MDAAELAVRQKGVDGFSYADLSARVGIRKASIHYHFPTKANLLTAIMARYRENTRHYLSRPANDTTTAAQKLVRFLDLYRDAMENCTALCLYVAYAVGQDNLGDETRTEIHHFRNVTRQWLDGVFRDGLEDRTIREVGDPAMEATAALALVEGAQISARFQNDLAVYDLAITGLLNRLVSG